MRLIHNISALVAVGALAIAGADAQTVPYFGLQHEALNGAILTPGLPGEPALHVSGMDQQDKGFAVYLGSMPDTPSTPAIGPEGLLIDVGNLGLMLPDAELVMTAYGTAEGSVDVKIGGTRMVAVDVNGDVYFEIEVDLDTPLGGANGTFTLNLYAEGSLVFSRSGLKPGKHVIRARQLAERMKWYMHRAARHPKRIINSIEVPIILHTDVIELDPCDANGNGQVGEVTDLLAFLANWFPEFGGGGLTSDLNGDGTVDVLDLLQFLGDCFFVTPGPSAGGPLFEGYIDKLEIIPDDPQAIDSIERVEITNGNDIALPVLDIYDEALHVYDVGVRAKGQAESEVDATGELVVSNVDLSGFAGLSLDVEGNSDVTMSTVVRDAASWVPSDQIMYQSYGLIAGDPVGEAGFAAIRRIDEGSYTFEADADLSILGFTDYRIEIYDPAGGLIGTETVTGLGAASVKIEVNVNAEIDFTWTARSGRRWALRYPSWELTISASGSVNVEAEGSVYVDVGRIVYIPEFPVQPQPIFEAYASLDILGTFLTTRTISFRNMLCYTEPPFGLDNQPLPTTDAVLLGSPRQDLVVSSQTLDPGLSVLLQTVPPAVTPSITPHGWTAEYELLGDFTAGVEMDIDVYGDGRIETDTQLYRHKLIGVEGEGGIGVDVDVELEITGSMLDGTFQFEAEAEGSVEINATLTAESRVWIVDPGRRIRKAIYYARRHKDDPQKLISMLRMKRPVLVRVDVEGNGSANFEAEVTVLRFTMDAVFLVNINAVTRVEVYGSSLPDIYIRRQKIRHSGYDFSATGTAVLEVDAEGSLVIRNVRRSGGVRVDLHGEASGGADLEVGPVDFSTSASATFSLSASGTFNGRAGRLGRIYWVGSDPFDGGVHLTAEFNAEFTAETYISADLDNPHPLASATIRGAGGGHVPQMVSFGKLPGDGLSPACFYIEFEGDVQIDSFFDVSNRIYVFPGNDVVNGTQLITNEGFDMTFNVEDLPEDINEMPIHAVVTNP